MESLDILGWVLVAIAAALAGLGHHDIWRVRTDPDYWAQGKKWWQAWFFTFDGDSMNPKGERHLDRGFLLTVGGLLFGLVGMLVLFRNDWTIGWS